MSSRTFVAAALVAALSLGVAGALERHADTAAGSTVDATASTVAAAQRAYATTTTTAEAQLDTGALEAIDTDARFSVAVLDVESGETLTYGGGTFDTAAGGGTFDTAAGGGTFDTASIVKVDILAALLTAQDGELTSTQQQLAAAMIERSDNAAATALFEQVGGVQGLTAYDATIGLNDTEVAAAWGLTQTTASDQLLVLQAALAFDTARDLMGRVVDTQRFGVSAAADDPADAVLKVGYLQRSATGLWDVTSIGEIVVGGRTYLVAVLSDGNATLEDGTTLVDAVARAALTSGTAT
jgi:hypothetical protein